MNYIFEMPCYHAKIRQKSAPQKPKFVIAKAISKSYAPDCSCKCPCKFSNSYAQKRRLVFDKSNFRNFACVSISLHLKCLQGNYIVQYLQTHKRHEADQDHSRKLNEIFQFSLHCRINNKKKTFLSLILFAKLKWDKNNFLYWSVYLKHLA